MMIQIARRQSLASNPAFVYRLACDTVSLGFMFCIVPVMVHHVLFPTGGYLAHDHYLLLAGDRRGMHAARVLLALASRPIAAFARRPGEKPLGIARRATPSSWERRPALDDVLNAGVIVRRIPGERVDGLQK
jgi:hypothetical protein